MSRLLAVPNVSEGRDARSIAAIAEAFTSISHVEFLDIHSDPDHHRTVFTLIGGPGELAGALTAGAGEAIRRIDLQQHAGVHPRVGALDVAPIVYLTDAERGAACAEALLLADRLADQHHLPVFLYGLLTQQTRTRADLRRGGPERLRARIASHELTPDFGPDRLHPTAGAVLVAARAPLVAFNVELAAPATEHDARRIAALIREGGPEGLPSVRAIGVQLQHKDVAQISTNIEDHRATTIAAVIQAISRYATPLRAEQVGLAPAAAYTGFPDEIDVANRRYLETVLSD